MASGPLRLKFVADVADFLRGLGKVEQAVDDVADEFKDVEKAGDRLERGLEDNFEDAARAARRAGDDIDRNLRDGTDNVGRDVGAEIGDEFVESWGEAIREGNPAEAIYETLTNAGNIAAQTLPLAGAVVGMGVAMVAGVVNGMRQAAAERQQEIKDAASGMLEAFRSAAGEQGGLTWGAFRDGFIDAQSRDQLLTEALGAGSLYEALDEIQQIGARAGSAISTDLVIALQDTGPAGEAAAARIQAAYDTALGRVQEQEAIVNELRARGTEEAGLAADTIEASVLPALNAEKAAIEEALGLIGDQQTAFTDAAGKVGLLNDALRQTATDLVNASVKAGDLDSAMAFKNTPSFQYLVDQLGYAAANAWSLNRALGTQTTQPKGIAIGALIR